MIEIICGFIIDMQKKNKIMKRNSVFIVLLLAMSSFVVRVDVVDEMAAAINSGNPKTITRFFVDNIDMKMIDKEEIYSKQQAEMMLKKFFDTHQVVRFAIAHKSEMKNGAQYAIGTLETKKGKFSIYFLTKMIGNKTFIQQFKIENG